MSGKKKHRRNRVGERGFSIIELLVVVGVIVIVMSVIVVNNNRQRSNVLTTNLAYDLALNFRQVQQYGIATKESPSGDFDRAYGVYFNSASLNEYYLFVDNNDNGITGSSESSEVTDTVALPAGWSFDRFCGVLSGGSEVCTPGTSNNLYISFKRPNPDARIKQSASTDYVSAYVTLRRGGDISTVTITNTGQISVSD